MRSNGATSEQGVVEEALRAQVELKVESGGSLLDLWRKIEWEGDLEQSRLSREFK